MGPLGSPDRKFSVSLWRFFLSNSVSPRPWCSLPLLGDLSSLACPGSLESLVGSVCEWRSLVLSTGIDRRVLDVVAGSDGSSCSSVSKSCHLVVPLYLPKPGNPDPRGHTILAFIRAGTGGCTVSNGIDVSGGGSDVGSDVGSGGACSSSNPRSVIPVWWSDVWLIQFGSWIPSWTWVGLSILKTWEVGRPTCCCRC